ncbi:hypothetical protein IVB27_32580 [Bradyrhizobium sp. 197]|uniref:hypothetical protein n=1 Tax=Bradyrhizobium sp. 197 TaxID=2782663 RepID=UPI001FFB6675|nr:hypothetical protein [Bradyrhizobium sp. 197]MCK1479352.1 hypothetical protein [Bradyrhizobium sp. 197]
MRTTEDEIFEDVLYWKARADAACQALQRIERGATSVLLDASLKGEPIHSDVLLEIVKDVRLALRQGEPR